MSNYDPNYIPTKSFALVGQKAIVLNKNQNILVLQRSEKSGAGGKWSLPGGALEQAENPFLAIQREIGEETELTVKNVRPFHIESYMDKEDFVVIVGYVCLTDMDNIKLNWEHVDFQWVSKKDALNLDLTSDGRKFIERFNNLEDFNIHSSLDK